MQFTRVLALVGFVLSAGMFASAAPAAVSNGVAARCSSGCTSGTDILGAVIDLKANVDVALSALGK